MKISRKQEYLCIGLFVSVVILLSTHSWGQEQASAVGELKLDGKHIERLVLETSTGRKTFDQPAETITLPVGKYRLQEIRLQGGYTCRIFDASERDWVTIKQAEPAVLKAGAPLKQVIKVERQRGLLELSYELLGVGGEKYTAGDRSKTPTFTVYKAEKKIASGEFEYG